MFSDGDEKCWSTATVSSLFHACSLGAMTEKKPGYDSSTCLWNEAYSADGARTYVGN